MRLYEVRIHFYIHFTIAGSHARCPIPFLVMWNHAEQFKYVASYHGVIGLKCNSGGSSLIVNCYTACMSL